MSRQRDPVPGQIFHNPLDAGFAGPVYPVNRAADVSALEAMLP